MEEEAGSTLCRVQGSSGEKSMGGPWRGPDCHPLGPPQVLALCHIAVGQQMNLHWLHKVRAACTELGEGHEVRGGGPWGQRQGPDNCSPPLAVCQACVTRVTLPASLRCRCCDHPILQVGEVM